MTSNRQNDYPPANAMTVDDLRRMLDGVPGDAPVIAGILDDEANLDGGIFVQADERDASGYENGGFQVGGYADVRQEIMGDPLRDVFSALGELATEHGATDAITQAVDAASKLLPFWFQDHPLNNGNDSRSLDQICYSIAATIEANSEDHRVAVQTITDKLRKIAAECKEKYGK